MWMVRKQSNDRGRLLRKCGVELGCFRFIKTQCARVGAMWTEGVEGSKVEAEWVS